MALSFTRTIMNLFTLGQLLVVLGVIELPVPCEHTPYSCNKGVGCAAMIDVGGLCDLLTRKENILLNPTFRMR